VLLEVYNLLGQRVTTLVNGPMDAGTHTVIWNGIDADGRQVATGVYFYRLTTPDYTDVKKMLLLK
jgi:flagellar hook assembly protein FlgD